jgi:hypothetical protein
MIKDRLPNVGVCVVCAFWNASVYAQQATSPPIPPLTLPDAV